MRRLLDRGDEVMVLWLTPTQQRERCFKSGQTYKVECDYEDLIYLEYPTGCAYEQAIPFSPDQIKLV